MRISGLLGAVVALGLSTAGNAASITILSPGNLGPTSGATFNSITATPYGQTTPSVPFSDGGADFSGSGFVMNNGGQPSLGLYATPLGDTTNYMAVLGGGSEKIDFSGLKNSFNTFGLYWGSVDTYNVLEFFNGNSSVATITGSAVQPPMLANGGQTDYASNGYVVIGALPFFDSVVVSSSANSFEFDNVLAGVGTTQFSATAAPEPSTWAMLLLGFAGLGYAGFRRSRGSISALA
jgi:PEP-CTERM motif